MVFKPDEDWENAAERGEWDSSSSSSSSINIGGLSVSPQQLLALAAALAGAAALAAAAGSAFTQSWSLNPEHLAHATNIHPVQYLQLAVTSIQSQGAMGYLYFGILYVVAEILAIPALPLTASSGYLFGLQGGCAVVLCSATIAAGVSFLLGRTFLRKWVEEMLADNPKFKAIDAAIAKEGFKIILLLRLSPIFPFALSNYLYGLTSVPFWPYLGATMLGFTPGTIAYVYGGGQVGNLLGGGAGSMPWYVYAGGLAIAAAAVKLVGDIATTAVTAIEPGIGGSSNDQEWD